MPEHSWQLRFDMAIAVAAGLTMTATIIFGAALIAALTASTEMHGFWLKAVSWLLCMIFFFCCLCPMGLCCAKNDRGQCGQCPFAPLLALYGLGAGLFASLLCIILSVPFDKLKMLRDAGPILADVNPIEYGLVDVQTYSSTGEMTFALGSYLDLSLGFAVLESKCQGDGTNDCEYDTVVPMCLAPVMSSCGAGATSSNATCAAAQQYCNRALLQPPSCRAPAPFPGYMSPAMLVHRDCDDSSPCPVCAGDCDDDSECAGSLKCKERDITTMPVHGCSGDSDGGSTGADENDDYCYDPSWVDPNRISLPVPFWLYIESGYTLAQWWQDPKEVCQRAWANTFGGEYDDITRGISLASMTTAGNQFQLSGHLDPMVSVQKEQIAEYLPQAGAVDSAGRAPLILKWQPKLGYQRDKLWQKITDWCWALGMGPFCALLCFIFLSFGDTKSSGSMYRP